MTDTLEILSGAVRKLTRYEKTLYPNYKYVTESASKYTYGDYSIEVPEFLDSE